MKCFFPAFWQLLFPFPKKCLIGCIPIPEHMKSLRCYPQTALPPSYLLVSQIKKIWDCKVGGEGGPTLGSQGIPWFFWQCEALRCLEGRKSNFLLFSSWTRFFLYFSQRNVGIKFCIDGPAFLKETKMDNSLSIPKERCHYFSS